MDEKTFDYEKELQRLEEISNMLESKTLSLDESVKLYEEGIKIAKALEEALKVSEEKINKVIEVK